MEDSSNFLETELEALKAIYNEIVVEPDDKEKKKCVSIDLRPATADKHDEQYVKLTLKLSLSEEYPHNIPEISIHNPRGLSEEKINGIFQDLKSLAESKVGNSMLFEIIEAAIEHLTAGNRPCGTCAICLHGFSDSDHFTKTDCYHYFHSHCLARYAQSAMAAADTEDEDAQKSSNELLCPMCRVAIVFIGQDADYPPPSGADEEWALSEDIRSEQGKMAEIYQKQLEKGGIIDLEAEKNKFLIEISNAPSRAASNINEEEISAHEETTETSPETAEEAKVKQPDSVGEKSRGRGNQNWDDRGQRNQHRGPAQDNSRESNAMPADTAEGKDIKAEGPTDKRGGPSRNDGNRYRPARGGGYRGNNSYRGQYRGGGRFRGGNYGRIRTRSRDNAGPNDTDKSPTDEVSEKRAGEDCDDRNCVENERPSRRPYPRRGNYKQGYRRNYNDYNRGNQDYSRSYPQKRNVDKGLSPEKVSEEASSTPGDNNEESSASQKPALSGNAEKDRLPNSRTYPRKPYRRNEYDERYQGYNDRKQYPNRRYPNRDGDDYHRNYRQKRDVDKRPSPENDPEVSASTQADNNEDSASNQKSDASANAETGTAERNRYPNSKSQPKKPYNRYEYEEHNPDDRRPYQNRKYSNDSYYRNDRQRNGYDNRQRNGYDNRQRNGYDSRPRNGYDSRPRNGYDSRPRNGYDNKEDNYQNTHGNYVQNNRGRYSSYRDRNHDYSSRNASSYDTSSRNAKYGGNRPNYRSQENSFKDSSTKDVQPIVKNEDIEGSSSKDEAYANKSQNWGDSEYDKSETSSSKTSANILNELFSSCSMTEMAPNGEESSHKESNIVPYSELNTKKVVPPPPGFKNPAKKVEYGLKAANPPPGFTRS